MAGMNIKNAEAQALAKELADLTGETMTEAVIVALRERLAEVRSREEHVRARTEAIMAIGREVASRIPPELRDKDWDAELYDERGLPR
jgi:antitoxin VapB